MTSLKTKLLIVCLVLVCSTFAQKQNGKWYFGYGAGLDFGSGSPTILKDGELRTNEGCATLSDAKGGLLLYTDGVKVWDRRHRQMPNGFGLEGSYTTTQSAVIVPAPGSKHRYYIFTVAQQIEKGGLAYSVVDMRSNGGYGDVVEKNKPVTSTITEKIAAVKHCNGKDVWVIVHQWNSKAFYAYLLTDKGLKKPVVSSVGAFHRQVNTKNKGESIGYMRVSPNGKRLALVIAKMHRNNIELFDFDSGTGKISNPISLSSGKTGYGVCFSPDNSKLYVSFETGKERIIQYDLNKTNIAASKYVVARDNGIRYGALQLAPNGKIYAATGLSFLDVINRPNVGGSGCQFASKQLRLGKVYSTYGLPEFMINPTNTASSGSIDLGEDVTTCASSIELGNRIKADAYLWSTGAVTPTIKVTESGQYWLKATSEGCGGVARDTINVQIDGKLDLDLGEDISAYCVSQVALKAPKADQYLWSSGETSRDIVIKKNGTYWVKVTKGSCTLSDSIKVRFRQRPPVFKSSKEFYPHNNGFNDKFDYILRGVSDFELKVFNPKKKLVFKSTDVKNKWDGTYKGKTVESGEYPWEVNYKVDCSGEKVSKKGTVKVTIRGTNRGKTPTVKEKYY